MPSFAANSTVRLSDSVISGMNLTVYGDRNTVSGMNGIVHGSNNVVSGMNSTVTGDYNTVSGMNSTVHGNHNTVSGMNSRAYGPHNTIASTETNTTFSANQIPMVQGVHILRNDHWDSTFTTTSQVIVQQNGGGRRVVQVRGTSSRPRTSSAAVQPLTQINLRRDDEESEDTWSSAAVPPLIQLNLRGDDEETDDTSLAGLVCLDKKRVVMSICCASLTACVACARSLYEGKRVGQVKCMLCQANVEQVFRVS